MSNLTENNRCPFCGAPLTMGVGHSCQDSEENEWIYMMADRTGCTEGARERVEMNKKWGWEPYKKGEIISKGD